MILANACGLLGLRVVECSDLSERVCRPCGRKIRNAVESFCFIKQNLADPDLQSVVDSPRSSLQRQKRLLPTTITPERSSSKSKQAKVGRKLPSSKQLFKEVNAKDNTSTDTIETDTDKTESKVQIVITYPNGEVVVKKLFDKPTVSLLRSVARKQWKAAANVVFNHDGIKAHIPDVVRRQVSSEFRLLSSESILKGTSPEELAAFSNKVFLHEVDVQCPLWYASMNGACGITPRQSTERRNRAINVMALSTSVLARHRNPSLSAIAHRVSMLLFHSGVSYYDTIRLNHLGICMSPGRMVHLQKLMGIASDSKVLIWKKSTEKILSAVLLFQEVKKNQVPEFEDDDMALDIEVEFSDEMLKSYTNYDKSTFEFCTKLLEDNYGKKSLS